MKNYEKKDITIELSPTFRKAFKRLAKKYRSLPYDLEKLIGTIKDDPMTGVDLGQDLRKVRMSVASKGKGKSGGARVITYTMFFMSEDKILLLTVYDKSEKENISDGELQDILKDNNL